MKTRIALIVWGTVFAIWGTGLLELPHTFKSYVGVATILTAGTLIGLANFLKESKL